ncbi:hypothetical protein [Streptomyces zaomyceticus]
MTDALAELRKAVDDALIDGLLVPQSRGTERALGGRSQRGTRGRHPGQLIYDESTLAMIGCLERLGRDIHTALKSSEARTSSETITSLRDKITAAEELRATLMSWLLDRIEVARSRQGGT